MDRRKNVPVERWQMKFRPIQMNSIIGTMIRKHYRYATGIIGGVFSILGDNLLE